ncbi:MAG TPA: alpha/beta fold hydrolase [Acidimicrobiales bacterium]|nr:alpha/beta fold hydrolase [Acidimicrobiales bacterium]
MPRILVHGFTQTAASWHGVLDGRAVEVEPQDDLWSTAARLGETAGAGEYVGYSMGGRLCLHLALARPHLVSRLVLLGAHPGIEDPDQRAARRRADEELARSIERDGVDAFLARWLSQPLFAGLQEPGPRQRDADVLTRCLRRLGTGVQEPLWDRLPELRMPVLVLAGERDERYGEVGRRTASAIGPHARFAVVPEAGHAAHLEQPAAFRRVFFADPAPQARICGEKEPGH